MRRLPDWRQRLKSYIDDNRSRQFKPGVHDCALFVAGGIEAQTGIDIAKPYRGRYKTEKGGLRKIKRDGYEDALAFAADHLDAGSIKNVVVGDVAVVETETGMALGIVGGPRIFVCKRDGLGTVPIDDAKQFFKV